MKYRNISLFLAALLAEVGTSWLEWAQLGPRDCFQVNYEGHFLLYELGRLVPWFFLLALLLSIWLLGARLVRGRGRTAPEK